MPLVYGEGAKTFRRLQLEIMKTSTDHSVFAWRNVYVDTESGPLAASPNDFKKNAKIVTIPDVLISP